MSQTLYIPDDCEIVPVSYRRQSMQQTKDSKTVKARLQGQNHKGMVVMGPGQPLLGVDKWNGF
jgi:hypothetical protein